MLPKTLTVRQPKQQRSQATRDKIARAAIELLGEIGEAGLTHRDVAARAGVSLATTTYHYASRFELLEHASSVMLDDYTAQLRAFAARQALLPEERPSFEQFLVRLLRNAVGRERTRALAWCEIMQIAARNTSTRALAQVWYMHLREIWSDISARLGMSAKPIEVLAAIDRTIGLLFVAVSLGLSPDETEACLTHGLVATATESEADASPLALISAPTKLSKGEETRQQLLAAAIKLMATQGAGAVTGRSVAAAAGVAPAVPSYYYKPIGTLIDAARQQLYQAARARYRESVSGIDRETATLDQIADLTTAVLTREVTQFSDVNLAVLAIETEAGRQAALRPMTSRWVADRGRAWDKLLTRFNDGQLSARHGQSMSCLFIGMQIRLLATGAEISALSDLRHEFLAALDSMGFKARTQSQ
jgi:DNA-binding transcriptional regulator YbjK